jgi:hypothetical protein
MDHPISSDNGRAKKTRQDDFWAGGRAFHGKEQRKLFSKNAETLPTQAASQEFRPGGFDIAALLCK